jgi:hypothetical protein
VSLALDRIGYGRQHQPQQLQLRSPDQAGADGHAVAGVQSDDVQWLCVFECHAWLLLDVDQKVVPQPPRLRA